MELRIEIVDNSEQLRAPEFVEAWRRLPHASPMQSPDWLIGWWKTYGQSKLRQLCVVVVRNAHHEIVAIAPWYVQTSLSVATLRMLGDGEVCSDHATIAVPTKHRDATVDRIAEWLQRTAGNKWQKIHFSSIGQQDATMARLVGQMSHAGFEPKQIPNQASFLVTLPDDWEQYLSQVSKNHRKRCRRWLRDYFGTNRAVVVEPQDPREIDQHWHHLKALHHQRRDHAGDETAFAQRQFCEFHRSFIDRAIPQQRASLRTLFVDGEPVGAEYLLFNEDTVFCYQSGAVTRQHRDGFGNLSILAVIRDAIARGYRHVDFLRGEEEYKSRWNGQLEAANDIVIRTNNLRGFVDGLVHQAIGQAKDIKSQLVGS